jgi:serine/threonine protein kinase/Tol biopolymer transport system component
VVSKPVEMPDSIRFGDDFELDVRAYELRSAGIPLKLKPIAMELLLLLVERRGQLVTREQIIDRIWGKGVFLDTDNSINGAISKIRQVLRDNAENPRFVQTVTGKGYRFVAPITGVGSPPGAQQATPQPPAPEYLIGKKVSHYRILQVLGGGGMGVVYKGEDLKLGRSVAIKFLPGELASDPKAFTRLESEARAASALEHPNICPIYELGEHEGQPFIVMQLLEGQTLQERIESAGQQRKPLSTSEVLDLALQVLAGLEAAHEKGIIHRDIKPANIFITANRREAKILDFGLAKMVEQNLSNSPPTNQAALTETSASQIPRVALSNLRLTRTGTTMGTAYYMSPEQVRGEMLDARTDVFSFGLVLYEMATGQRAFPGNTAAVVHDAILHFAPPPIQQLNPELSDRLEPIITKALEKDRKLRYQSAADMRTDLQRLKSEMDSGLWAASGDTSDGSAIAAITQQHKTGVVLSGLVALAVLVAAGFGIYSLIIRTGPQPFKDFTVTQITNTGRAEQAAISPDGKYVFHVHNENGMRNIRLRNILTGSDTQIIAPAPARYKTLVFSPDGNYLYFRQLINSAGTEWDLYRLPVLGGTPQLIARDVDSDITFSPDARRLAFVRANDPEPGKYRLLSANLDGGDETVLAIENILGVGNEAYPPFSAWSGNGKRIAYSYAKMSDLPGVIRAFDLVSKRFSVFQQVANTLTFEVRWLPSDRWLMVVYSEKGPNFGRSQIGEVSIADGKLHPVTRDTNSYNTLTLSADGRTAATIQVKTIDTLDLFPNLGLNSQPAAVPRSQVEDVSAFDWTTDGKFIVSDGSKLLRVGTDGVKEMALASDPSAAVLSVAHCSNTYVLVNWAYRAGRDGSTIWRVNPDGSNPKQLSSGTYDTSPACSPDGKWAYYVDSVQTLMRVPVEGGPAEVVPGSKAPNFHRLLGSVDFSPDGRHLVLIADTFDPVANRPHGKIAIVDLDSRSGSLPHLVDSDPRVAAGSIYTGGARFSPDGKSVVYVIREGAGNLWMQPLDGSPGHQITNFTSDQITGFRWSPDGKTLAVMRAHNTSDVVVLRETNE